MLNRHSKACQIPLLKASAKLDSRAASLGIIQMGNSKLKYI